MQIDDLINTNKILLLPFVHNKTFLYNLFKETHKIFEKKNKRKI